MAASVSQMAEAFSLGFKAQRSWGVLIALGLFLGGLGAGMFLVSQFMDFAAGALGGVLIMGLGALSFLSDLGRPWRFWRAYFRPVTSWMSRGVLFMTLFALLGVLSVAPSLGIEALPWSKEGGLGMGLYWAAGVFAFLVMMYTGLLLSTPPAISFWNTTLLPALFLVYALLGGIDALLLWRALLGDAWVSEAAVSLEALQLLLVTVSLIFIALYLVIMGTSTISARASARLILRGPLSRIFLGGVVAVGLVIPWLAGIYGIMTGVSSPALWAVASLLVLLGSFLFRYIILKVGLYSPPL
ncbi:MAG: polysulfide reductase NrfD [Chloroflexi bacterium]|nr:polysulfide reductase NrfD [Chloroflexota bacterium]